MRTPSERLADTPSALAEPVAHKADNHAALKTALLSMYSHRGDGIPTQQQNPDGPDAVKVIEALQAEVDDLTASNHLKADFVEQSINDSAADYDLIQTLQARVAVLEGALKRGKARERTLKNYIPSCGCDGALDDGCVRCTRERLDEAVDQALAGDT